MKDENRLTIYCVDIKSATYYVDMDVTNNLCDVTLHEIVLLSGVQPQQAIEYVTTIEQERFGRWLDTNCYRNGQHEWICRNDNYVKRYNGIEIVNLYKELTSNY